MSEDLLRQALENASPSSSKTTKRKLQQGKRKTINMSPLPSLQKLAPNKKSKRAMPPPADSAAPVSGLGRRKLGKPRGKGRGNGASSNNKKVVKELADVLIKECAPIRDETLRSRRRSELKREWKRRHLNLTSDQFNLLWNEARKLLNQAILSGQEVHEDKQDTEETRLPSPLNLQGDRSADKHGNEAAIELLDKMEGGPSISSKQIANDKIQETNSSASPMVRHRQHVENEEAPSPVAAPDASRVDEFEGAGTNPWTDLFVGVQFEGKGYSIADWDTRRTHF
eukprot:scaffold4903_cov125-Cylindrotheca_fusiformis.AAC.7